MESDPSLIHLIYASAAARPLARNELLGILAVAHKTNTALAVTGILLYIDDTFFQVLEGPAEAVMPLFHRIGQDSRHQRVLKLIQEPIMERAFPDWSMGYAAVTRSDLATIPGLTDFFQSQSTVLDLPESRTRTLLAAFAEGRWRAQVLP